MPAIAADPATGTTGTVVHVAVGVIRGKDNQVLVALRLEHSHQGGLWEFPGGKLEPGEGVTAALARELHEELGITVRAQKPLCRIQHDYGDKHVLLDVWTVEEFDGDPVGRQGQPLRWMPVSGLQMHEFPVANRGIIRRLQLPELIAITGQDDTPGSFFDRFEQVLAQGISMVQLRLPGVSADEYRLRAMRCAELCQVYNARLLLNAEPELVAEVGAAGFHASAERLLKLQQRPVGDDIYFSASCHDLPQLRHAAEIGADFALLSPVLRTATHPDASPLGWSAFQSLATQSQIPCYALGGLSRVDLDDARSHGALGIAAIRAFW